MRNIFLVAGLLSGTAVCADVPQVASDIAPVHGLVSRVMEGVGEPALLVPPGASPHGYAMRPSEARALSEAAVVFWVGESLSPWLAAPIETLADDAVHITLADIPGITALEYRTGARFEAHDHAHEGEEEHDSHEHDAKHDDHEHEHDHAHEQQDDHAKDEHDDDNHADDHGHEEHGTHAKDEHNGDEHAHDSIDTHMWLNPENAIVWIDAIAATLAKIDPENTTVYEENASAAKSELAVLSEEIEAQLKPFSGKPFIVFHDSYHYFEDRFGVEAAGSIALGDESGATAARLSEVREVIDETGASCVLVEPRSNKGLVEAVSGESDLNMATVDAIGVDIPLGPTYYTVLLKQIADRLEACLG